MRCARFHADDRRPLRERKKAQTRERIADVAAHLFAEHGFDEVSVLDVAHLADVSEQTVYSYFPAKHDLALDRAQAIRQRYYDVVVDRPDGTSPAAAVRVLAAEDIECYRTTSTTEARGEFYALCISSPVVRRFGLEVRDGQVQAIGSAITETCPGLHPALVHTHAAALVSVFQMLADRIGRSVLNGEPAPAHADQLTDLADTAFDDLHQHFLMIIDPATLT